MDHSIDMMLRYPSVVPVNLHLDGYCGYKGYLPVNGIDYAIDIYTDDKGQPKLAITPQLLQFEQQLIDFQNSSECTNIVALIDAVRNLLITKTRPRLKRNPTHKYRFILNEYMELRDFYIGMQECTISNDLSQIKLVQGDEFGRVNELLVACKLDENEDIFQVVMHTFPDIEKTNIDLFKNSNSLKDIYEKFLLAINSLQKFYQAMDSFDNNCWILDPEKPSREDCYRRIGLEPSLSMIVTVNPWVSNAIPDIKFLGPEKLVEKYREKLLNNLSNWNSKNDILDELLVVLELSNFPQKPTLTGESEVLLYNSGECCICFMARLNNMLPEIICQNVSCKQFFHSECLRQWLVSVGAKHSFNELHGECPNCEKHITCPIK